MLGQLPVQLLAFWNLFFFQFFPPKLVYFWTKNRKNTYGCFFHSFCASDLNFGINRMKYSTLKTLTVQWLVTGWSKFTITFISWVKKSHCGIFLAFLLNCVLFATCTFYILIDRNLLKVFWVQVVCKLLCWKVCFWWITRLWFSVEKWRGVEK